MRADKPAPHVAALLAAVARIAEDAQSASGMSHEDSLQGALADIADDARKALAAYKAANRNARQEG